VVVEDEAERVRTIFRRYLELGSLNLLMADLRERRITAIAFMVLFSICAIAAAMTGQLVVDPAGD
jgi:hypothetical protein